MTFKYEDVISRKFADLGFEPRPYQIGAVDQVLTAYLDERKENVILSAPTGSGKSIIAVIVADCLAEITSWEKGFVSVISMSTNALAEQYRDSFKGNKNFLVVKGASNYHCSVTGDTAESCVLAELKKADMTDIIDAHCSKCEFNFIKTAKHRVRHLITNFSYVFVDRLYLREKGMEPRLINVFDEAHTLNDAFVEHNAISISEKRLNSIVDELSHTLQTSNIDIFNKLKKFKKEFLAGRINEDNYLVYLETLMDIYGEARDSYKHLMDGAVRKGMKNFDNYTKLSKLQKKYEGLYCKIDDFFIYKYEHVFDYKEKEQELSVKPIFVGDMGKQLKNSKYTLYMSATMNEEFMVSTLGMEKTLTKYIHLPPVFPAANKMVVYYKPQKLNYKTMSDPTVVNKLLTNCAEIFKNHDEFEERGIFLAPSFDVAHKVADRLRTQRLSTKIFEHERGQKLVDILSMFKDHSGKAVLISPSMWEGIDLPGEMSRYQVMIKCPFPSLADKRLQYIAEKYSHVYKGMTIQKIVQGIGRSVRSMDDYAVTYFTDSQLLWLFESKENSWLDEFSIVQA